MWGFNKSDHNARMIREQIAGRGVRDSAVICAMEQTNRKIYVPPEMAGSAYEDRPIPLMPGATVSQPYIVALMSSLLDVRPGHRLLEVGTGSGYQAAVLTRLGAEVYTVEMQEPLVHYAKDCLKHDGDLPVHVIHGDGWQGWPDAAPYDRIMVTAAPDTVPEALQAQLKPGGKMVIPVGTGNNQELQVIEKLENGECKTLSHSPVRFVPLINTQNP